MTALFPFNLPAPTAFYIVLYVLTFAISQACMHYVLAGSLYVAWALTFPGRAAVARADQPLGSILRDWLPFVLSAAITAGVAPLLFVQVLYPRHFYTANLLLWWRWMVVVPFLIAAFYLLYLLKSNLIRKWPRLPQLLVAWSCAVLFLFVGFCWTANALLGQRESNWPQIYVSERMHFTFIEISTRMSIWIGAAFPTVAAIISWQLLHHQARQGQDAACTSSRSLALTSFGGLIVLIAGSLGYVGVLSPESRQALLADTNLPYIILTAIGVAMQCVGWGAQFRSNALNSTWSTVNALGVLLVLLGGSFTRETLRASVIQLATMSERHAQAAQVEGFVVFLVFAVFALLGMFWSIHIVRQGLK